MLVISLFSQILCVNTSHHLTVSYKNHQTYRIQASVFLPVYIIVTPKIHRNYGQHSASSEYTCL